MRSSNCWRIWVAMVLFDSTSRALSSAIYLYGSSSMFSVYTGCWCDSGWASESISTLLNHATSFVSLMPLQRVVLRGLEPAAEAELDL